MGSIGIIFKRELMGYFATPLAYIFIVIFLIANGIFTFELGGFFLRGQADLLPFFGFHPWLYLFMVPAIAMSLWADERKTGTIELLITLPIKLSDAVIGKFLAAWVLTGIALALTFPIWITVNYLGDPDNGVIFAAYIGSWLMAGGFLSIGSCMSTCRSGLPTLVMSFMNSYSKNCSKSGRINGIISETLTPSGTCLLYTSDAADE